MLINVDGEWTEMVGDWPVTVPYDDSQLSNEFAVGANRGCPPGYFAQLISQSNYGVPWGLAGSHDVMVCRRADSEIINSPALIAAESGPGGVEQTVINAAAAAKTTVDTVREAGAAVGSSFMKDIAPWLIGGAVAYLLLSKSIDKVLRA